MVGADNVVRHEISSGEGLVRRRDHDSIFSAAFIGITPKAGTSNAANARLLNCSLLRLGRFVSSDWWTSCISTAKQPAPATTQPTADNSKQSLSFDIRFSWSGERVVFVHFLRATPAKGRRQMDVTACECWQWSRRRDPKICSQSLF